MISLGILGFIPNTRHSLPIAPSEENLTQNLPPAHSWFIPGSWSERVRRHGVSRIPLSRRESPHENFEGIHTERGRLVYELNEGIKFSFDLRFGVLPNLGSFTEYARTLAKRVASRELSKGLMDSIRKGLVQGVKRFLIELRGFSLSFRPWLAPMVGVPWDVSPHTRKGRHAWRLSCDWLHLLWCHAVFGSVSSLVVAMRL